MLSFGAFAQLTPTVNSDPVTTGTYGTPYIYNITTDAWSNDVDLSLVTPAPPGLTFTPDPVTNGLAELSGAPTATGSYSVIIRVADKDDPLLFSLQSFTLNIGKATLVVTADNQSRPYGSSNPALTFSYSGFVNGDDESDLNDQKPHTSTAATSSSDAGPYPITLSASTDNNYTYEFHDAVLTVTKVVLTATADDKTRPYGTPDFTSYTISYSGFVNNDTESQLTQPGNTKPTANTQGSTINAGTYAIKITGGFNNNYTFNGVDGSLIVTKVTATITADSKSKVYGEVNPELTFSYAGLVNNDLAITTPPTISVAADEMSPVGPYEIKLKDGSDNNYNLSLNSGTLTITKASLTITAQNQTRAYGDPNPPLTVTYSGFVNGDGPGVFTHVLEVTTVGPTADVSSYGIVPSAATAANYDIHFTQGTLVITKAMLTATADDQSRPYGTANPQYTITYSGFKNGEDETVLDATKPVASTAPGITTTAPVGQYNITITPGTDNNYDFTYISGKLTITKVTPVVTWNQPAAIIYGTPLSATQLNASSTIAGSFVYTPASGTVLNTGTQTLSVTFTPTDVTNYDVVTGVTTTIVVNKATPVVTWNQPSAITYGTPLSATQLNASSAVAGSFVYTPAAGTVLNAGTQTLSVNFTPADLANYNVPAAVTTTIVVNKATPVITWASPANITYGTPLSTTQLNASANVAGSFVYTPAVGTVLNAGLNQTLKADFHPTDAVNYNDVLNITRQISVDKATPVITWANPANITYGTPLSTTQLNASANVAGSFVYTPATGTVLNAGANQALKADFHPTDAANYADVLNIMRQLTVDKATPTVNWPNPANITYGTPLSATQLNATFSVPGIATYIPGAGTILPTGDNQVISVNFTPTNTANYNSITGATAFITVIKANPVVTWATPADIVYGTALSATQLNVVSNVPGTVDYTPPAGTILDAGNGQILKAKFTPNDLANYNIIPLITTTINVAKANPTVTWATPAAITYGTALNTTDQLNATFSVPGTAVYSPPAGTILNAGTQTLSMTFTPTDVANYNVATRTRNITVNKATPVVTWANPTQIAYGTPLVRGQQLNATANVAGVFTYTPVEGTILNVGPNQVLSVKFTPTDLTNYNIVPTTNAQITVIKATPVVSWAPPLPIKVGEQLSSGTNLNATANVAGSFTYTPAAGTSFGAEGTYTLRVDFTPTDQVHYNVVSNTTVQITVNSKFNPTITWNDPAAITYGTALTGAPGGQLVATASVPGTFTYDPVAGSKLNAGTNQSLNVTFVPTDGVNYNTVSKTVHINVNKAALTVKASDATRTYGATNPTFNITYTGFVNSENETVIDTKPAATTTAGPTTPVQNVPITVSGGSDDNYTFTYTPGTLTITKAQLTATADNKSRPYGSANPSNSITYTGFMNTDGPTSITQPGVSTGATTTSNVGTYPITVSGGSATNYQLVLVNGTLTVTPVMLTVKANNQARPYGALNPPLTLNYSGFVNGQGTADIDKLPEGVTNATSTSPVNTYDINVSGGVDVNYSFNYVAGILTINKAGLTATAESKVTTYGTIPDLTIAYTGLMNGESASVLDQEPTISSVATATSDIGMYDIKLSGGSDDNYNITIVNGKLTINKAVLTVTADNKSKIFGFANPTLTVTYSGFVNNETQSVIDVLPTASTIATTSSGAGDYAINVTGGADDHYSFTYQPGKLTVFIDNPPVVSNFITQTDEDVSLPFTLASFQANYSDDPNGKIVYVKIITVPTNGALYKSFSTKVVAGEELTVTGGQLGELYYLPNANYNGSDSFTWNVFDGTFMGTSNATVSITINPVNDPPSLSNIEQNAIVYAPGDPKVKVSEQIIITDVDNSFVFSATVSIGANFTHGDQLTAPDPLDLPFNTSVKSIYDPNLGVLSITGKDTRANYEAILHLVTFNTPVNSEAVASDKLINIIARDSIANSNVASRTVTISQVFPELDLVNAFTPNGDGVNDEWDILNMEYYNDISVAIYNTDGVKVYECKTQDCRWDGTYKNKPQPPGPYFYAIDLNDGRRTYRGTVTILK
ncbi:MAG: MBG domain-containing protein [Bacteroidota bacterium]